MLKHCIHCADDYEPYGNTDPRYAHHCPKCKARFTEVDKRMEAKKKEIRKERAKRREAQS